MMEINVPRQNIKFKKSNASVPQKILIAVNSKSRCAFCGKFLYLFDGKTHVDHLIAWENGGDNSLENLKLSCDVCNVAKGATNAEQNHGCKKHLEKDDVIALFLETLLFDYCMAYDQFSQYKNKDFHTRNEFNKTLQEWFDEAYAQFKPTAEHKKIREASIISQRFLKTY